MRQTLYRFGTFVGLCMLAVPILIYLAGQVLAGPYDGSLGLLGLVGHLYGDVLLGRPAAWFLLASPNLLALVWYAVAWLRRTRLFGGKPPGDAPT